MLRNTLIGIAVILVPLLGYGQIVLDITDLPCVGDAFTMSQVDSAQGAVLSPGASGPNVSWDFSSLTEWYNDGLYYGSSDTTPNGAFFTSAELVSTIGDGDFLYHRKTGMGMYWVGIENVDDDLISFFEKEVLLFPLLNYGDSVEFDGRAGFQVGVDSVLFINLSGWSKADAWGSLTLPSGTIDVIRVYTSFEEVDSLYISGVGQEVARDSTLYYYKFYAKELGVEALTIGKELGLTLGADDYQTAFYANNLTPTEPCIPDQEICLVTVDTVLQRNLVVWEKAATTAITSYNIYKETVAAGVYALEGNVLYDSLSVFLDVNSNPAVKADRYKISAIYNGGTETPQSAEHKTIHMTMNLGIGGEVNLLWDDYEGISFGTYNIYKGNASGMNLLGSVASTLTSYTDLSPSSSDSLYLIEVVAPSVCMATKVKNFNSSKSNTSSVGTAPTVSMVLSSTSSATTPCTGTATATVSGGMPPYTYSWNTVPPQTTITATGLCPDTYVTVTVTTADPTMLIDSIYVQNVLSTQELKLSQLFNVYPNPSEGLFTIEGSGALNEMVSLKVLNILGGIVIEERISANMKKVIDLSQDGSGLYLVQIESSMGTTGKKIMIK